MNASKKTPLIRRPWFAFFSSMRFAVALLCILGIASVIGTVLQQNQSMTDYVVKFGPFWTEIFHFLGLFDVYASAWFVVIMLFLVLSTGLCLWRNIPPFLREMKSYRLKATAQSLSLMKHTAVLDRGALTPDIAQRYLNVQGYSSKVATRDDGMILVAAKKGAMNKWGYIFAHLAIIIVCLGGLIDSNLVLKIGMLVGKIVPDNQAVFARDFKPHSILSTHNPSFRGNVNITEGQSADVVFLNTDKGALVQELPFSVKLKKFNIEFYNTGMPRDFASTVEVTDKATGKTFERTIRVNHPLTLHGITIYQASFSDGGSDLRFKAWDLSGNSKNFANLQAVSMQTFPLNINKQQPYSLEFDKLIAMNVEDMSGSGQPESFEEKWQDVRSVKSGKHLTNIGPSIVYRLRDKNGQAIEFKNYMQPIQQEGDYFYITGTRSGLEQQYRWLRIPADKKGNIDTFMAWRETINDPVARERIVAKSVQGVAEKSRAQFTVAVDNAFMLFAQGGYVTLNEFIDTKVPKNEQEKIRNYFYQIIYGVMNTALDDAIAQNRLPEWPQDDARNRFLINALDSYTGLKMYPAPILLQLDGFKEVRSSGLQMTKSPGATLVYLGSVLLVLGIVFMFYIREKRIWLLFDGSRVRLSMSSARNERDVQKTFPKHLQHLEQLAKDLKHE